jgi:hypothetical protein
VVASHKGRPAIPDDYMPGASDIAARGRRPLKLRTIDDVEPISEREDASSMQLPADLSTRTEPSIAVREAPCAAPPRRRRQDRDRLDLALAGAIQRPRHQPSSKPPSARHRWGLESATSDLTPAVPYGEPCVEDSVFKESRAWASVRNSIKNIHDVPKRWTAEAKLEESAMRKAAPTGRRNPPSPPPMPHITSYESDVVASCSTRRASVRFVDSTSWQAQNPKSPRYKAVKSTPPRRRSSGASTPRC